MKIILSILIAAVICYLAQAYIPVWWIFAVVTFLIAIVIKLKSGWQHFFAGFFPVLITWLILFYMADQPNNSILSNKIAMMFSMPNHHVLFFVSSFIMGIIGGLTAVAGGTIRKRK